MLAIHKFFMTPTELKFFAMIDSPDSRIGQNIYRDEVGYDIHYKGFKLKLLQTGEFLVLNGPTYEETIHPVTDSFYQATGVIYKRKKKAYDARQKIADKTHLDVAYDVFTKAIAEYVPSPDDGSYHTRGGMHI